MIEDWMDIVCNKPDELTKYQFYKSSITNTGNMIYAPYIPMITTKWPIVDRRWKQFMTYFEDDAGLNIDDYHK